jgi:flagellar protein FlgJ
MRPKEFVLKYYPFALQIQKDYGINAIAILAQCAVETGWGKTVVGNMMFGVKDSDGINGNEQLLTTFEYLSHPNAKFPVIISIKQIAKNRYKYIVKEYFRKYKTPEDSFRDHALLIKNKSRYIKAWENRGSYKMFLTEVAKAGYSTSSGYAATCIQVGNMIQNLVNFHKLAK